MPLADGLADAPVEPDAPGVAVEECAEAEAFAPLDAATPALLLPDASPEPLCEPFSELLLESLPDEWPVEPLLDPLVESLRDSLFDPLLELLFESLPDLFVVVPEVAAGFLAAAGGVQAGGVVVVDRLVYFQARTLPARSLSLKAPTLE